MNHNSDKKNDKKMDITEKITLVAEMYYTYRLTQQEIAERLGISRPWVSKLLDRAIDLGIVRIEVVSYFANFKELEKQLFDKYGVKVYIVKNSASGESYTNIGKAASNYLLAKIRPGDTIGVSWGVTLTVMIDELIPMKVQGVKVVPLVGGLGSRAEYISNLSALKLSEKLDCQCVLLHAQAYCSSPEEKEAVLSNPQVSNVIEMGNHSDIALIGVGDLYTSTIAKSKIISDEIIKEMESYGAIGDISLWFIDKDGKIIDRGINKNIIACSLQEVTKNAREVICMACGDSKIKVLDAAMRGGWFTTLFTDVNTAKGLLNYK